MPYWQLFYHVIFATQQRAPLLSTGRRTEACRLMTHKAQTMGCVAHAMHSQPDHVHLVLSIPPSMAVASIIGQIKGSSSHALATSSPPDTEFAWQRDYGVLSFGRRHLSDVMAYVNDQDRRHADRDLWPELERISLEDGGSPASRTMPSALPPR